MHTGYCCCHIHFLISYFHHCQLFLLLFWLAAWSLTDWVEKNSSPATLVPSPMFRLLVPRAWQQTLHCSMALQHPHRMVCHWAMRRTWHCGGISWQCTMMLSLRLMPPMLRKDCYSAEQCWIATCSCSTAQVSVMLSNAKDLALQAVSIDGMQQHHCSGWLSPTLLPSCRAMPHMLLLHCGAMPHCSMQPVPHSLVCCWWCHGTGRLIVVPPSNATDKVYLLLSNKEWWYYLLCCLWLLHGTTVPDTYLVYDTSFYAGHAYRW